MTKVKIGSRYEPKPSIFSQRTPTGSYWHKYPPMTWDDELVQSAMLKAPRKGALSRLLSKFRK